MTAPPDNTNHFIGSASLDGDEAAIAAARDAAAARNVHRQAESAQFIVEHGAAVVGGHTPEVVIRPVEKTPMSGDQYVPYAT